MNLEGQLSHNLEIGSDPLGNISCINHALEFIPKQFAEAQTKLETVEYQLALSALNVLINMDEKAMVRFAWMIGRAEGKEENLKTKNKEEAL